MEEDEKKAALRKKIEHQVACEEKAFRIVEKLIDNPISEEYLLDVVHYITPSHYSDVTEERAVAKLCGYPLCPKPLGKVLKQKYMISTKTKKVYDIEARKNFCSGVCYKASQYLEKQISTEPVWARKDVTRPHIKLQPLDQKFGKLGDEVISSKREDIRKELKKLDKIDRYHDLLQERKLKHSDIQDGSDREETVEEASDITVERDCVYTLDKAMKEMKIEVDDEDSEKPDCSGVTVKRNKENVTVQHSDSSIGTHMTNEENEVRQSSDVSGPSEGKISDSLNTGFDKSNDIKETAGLKEAFVNMKPESNKHCRVKTKENLSKTEYLIKLLDKRKALLSKMADVQLSVTEPVKHEAGADATHSSDVEKSDDSYSRGKTELEPIGDEVKRNNKEIEIKELKSVNSDSKRTVCSIKATNVAKSEKQHVAMGERPDHVSKAHKVRKESDSQGRKLSTLELIGQTIRDWITRESIEYLNNETDDEENTSTNKSEFQKKYNELVSKVDAQEKEFDNLIGEESLEGGVTSSGPSAPAPHFEVLKKEAEKEQLRVREFMKGSFTFKEAVAEDKKTTVNASGVVLPVVDKYDQLLIRRKIVIERISRVLPDLLSPLQLLTQDVYTELRELVLTFNVGNKNILFKPGEWTVVSLILLFLLSRRLDHVRAAFKGQRASQFLAVFLKGLDSNLEDLENLSTSLIQF